MISRTQRSFLLTGALATVFAGFLCGDASVALAQKEVEAEENTATKLARAPAVRHRLLLVKGRIELSPTFESTMNADYKHTIGGGLKAEYHLTDTLSVGGIGVFGTNINTGLVDRIIDTLPDNVADPLDPTPTKKEFEQHLNSMPVHGAAYVALTPWYGKLAAFGNAFVNFDFYFQGGLAFASLTSNCDTDVCYDENPLGGLNPDGSILPPDNDPNNDYSLNDGLRLGLYLGGGIHVFLNEWIALDLTVRDYLFADNPSGLDFNADLAVSDEPDFDDGRFLNHLFIGVGVSIFLPPKAVRTR